MSRSNSILETVERALRVLLLFSKDRPEWRSSELAQVLGVHRSVTIRILKTLKEGGFVYQARPYGRYSLGVKLVELGNISLNSMDLWQISYPFLKRLVRETEDSACLCVRHGDDAICVGKMESLRPTPDEINVGDRSPLYASAFGKTLLAYSNEDVLDELVARGLEPITPLTVTEPIQLRADIAQVRRRGWAYSVGESKPDVAAMAVPLWDKSGKVVASFGLFGPASRIDRKRLPYLLYVTRRMAEEMSSELVD